MIILIKPLKLDQKANMAQGNPCHTEKAEWPTKNLVCFQSSWLKNILELFRLWNANYENKKQKTPDSVPRDQA